MVAAIFIVVGMIVFAASFVAGNLADGVARRAREWPRTQGKVVDVTVVSLSQGTYTPRISYSYEVAGKGYANDRRRPGGNPYFYRMSRAVDCLTGFEVGAPVTVYYRANDPRRSAIEIEPFSVIVPILRWLGVGLLIGGLVARL